ncbi:MAG: glycosyltransferase family 4 protein [Halieaceae bacterium]
MNKRLLVLNVHYAPQSFGGATIVAEELNSCLVEEHGWDITVISTHVDPAIPAYNLRRYHSKSVEIISINLPTDKRYLEEYDNVQVNAIVERLLRRIEPDIVHAHALQRLGCGYFNAIGQLGIPLVVTVHDAWWLCDRQFMVDGNGRYCFQHEVKPERCRYCVDLPSEAAEKMRFLRQQLALADLVLAPSQFQRELYVANGIPADRCLVNGNGISAPRPLQSALRREGDKLVLGFIGGPGPLKGSGVIIQALNELPEYSNYTLQVVDAAQNIGVSWQDHGLWRVPGDVVFHPAYDQSTMDEFFAKIDVLLFPSQWKESFGLTVREALARDVWVIACSEGGVGEAIVDGENGVLIPMTSRSEPLREAICSCLQQVEKTRSHQNPHKSRIKHFGDQAAELSQQLERLIGQR